MRSKSEREAKIKCKTPGTDEGKKEEKKLPGKEPAGEIIKETRNRNEAGFVTQSGGGRKQVVQEKKRRGWTQQRCNRAQREIVGEKACACCCCCCCYNEDGETNKNVKRNG